MGLANFFVRDWVKGIIKQTSIRTSFNPQNHHGFVRQDGGLVDLANFLLVALALLRYIEQSNLWRSRRRCLCTV